jgi:DNA-binding MarR family transcriptional regulator
MLDDKRKAVVAEIRRFNRFYTRRVGLLEETLAQSAFTLTEARVLFELGHREHPAAADGSGERGFLARAFHLDLGPAAASLARQLFVDAAYMTRILRKFAGDGLVETKVDPTDRRKRSLRLTTKGESVLAALQGAADRDMARLVDSLSDDKLVDLRAALRKAAELLGDPALT